MAAVAAVAVLLAAWLYRRENADVGRSFTSLQIHALSEDGTRARRLAAENLASCGAIDFDRVLPVLAMATEDPQWEVRRAAAGSLGTVIRRWRLERQGAGREIELAMVALVRACDDARAEVRLAAVYSLSGLFDFIPGGVTARGPTGASLTIGTSDGRVLVPLLRTMYDSDPAVRAAAEFAFNQVPMPSGESLEHVVKTMMNDPAPAVRAAAVVNLGGRLPVPDWVFPMLLRRFEEVTSAEERMAIGWALGNAWQPPVESFPGLIEALSSDDRDARRWIPKALTKLGPAARRALPALAKAAGHELADLRGTSPEALQAIALIDASSVEAQSLLMPLVAQLRTAPDPHVRQQAATVLMLYGPSAAAAVPTLGEALKSQHPDVRQLAAYLLGTIGPAARSELADLIDLARDDPDDAMRAVAGDAIARIDVQ
jgi:HEAT repeat protein